MKLLGIGAALCGGLQVAYLTWPSAQGEVAAAITALFIWQLWSMRSYLNQHADMFLLMAAYGGAGMLPLPGAPSCHISPQALLTMNAGMLVLGVPAMLFGSRCLAEARRQRRLGITLFGDVAGMLAGMAAAHRLMPTSLGSTLLPHLTMLLGMLAGMGILRMILTRILGRIANVYPRVVPL